MASRKKVSKIEPSYWAQSWLWLLVLVASLALFGCAAWQVYEHTLKGWEFTLLTWVNHWPENLRSAAIIVAMLGSIWAAALLVVTTFVFRLFQLAWRLALSVLIVYGLALFIQEFLERPQPGMLGIDIHARLVEVGPSFPSTHVAVATVLGVTCLTYIGRWWCWPVVIGWIGVVAVSRLYLGVSAPLDVLGGLALGVGVVAFWHVLPKVVKKILRLKDVEL